MFVSNCRVPCDSPLAIAGSSRAEATVALLEELLVETIAVRDLYKLARCRTADMQFSHLRALFDAHYKEQLRLVDVLVDRIRALGGAGRVLAGTFLQGAPPTRGRSVANQLFYDLINAHESVLSVAQGAGSQGRRADSSSVHDFAVGQAVLTNEQQGCAVQEQLASLGRKRPCATTSFSGVDAGE